MRYPDLPDPDRLAVEGVPPELWEHLRELQCELRKIRKLRGQMSADNDLVKGFNQWRLQYERQLDYTTDLVAKWQKKPRISASEMQRQLSDAHANYGFRTVFQEVCYYDDNGDERYLTVPMKIYP